MLLFNAVCLVLVGLFLSIPVLSSALVFSVVYVWCQINRDVIVNFWFGVQVKVSRDRSIAREKKTLMYLH